MRFLRRVSFLLALALLICGELVLNAKLWLGWPDETFSFLQPLSCVLPPLCQLRYPKYFGIVLLGFIGALALFYDTLRSVSGKLIAEHPTVIPLSFNFRRGSTEVNPEQEPNRAAPANSALRIKWFRLAVALAVASTSLVVYQSLTPPGNPHPLLWLLSLSLVGLMFYCGDRASQRRALLSRRETLLLFGYIIFLLALGYAFRNDGTRVLVVCVVLVLAAWLWRRRRLAGEVIAVALLAMLALAVYTVDLMSWRYSFIGDEYAFFDFAIRMMNGLGSHYLLSPKGTYEVHPVFASFLQSATMFLYGQDVYGWRISESLAVVLAALPLYVFVRTFTPARMALLSALIFLSSQHLMGLSKVGYTYSQLLLPLTSAFALFALAARRGSLFGLFLSGVASAFAFYTFAFGIPFISLLVLLFVLYYVTVKPRTMPQSKGESTPARGRRWLRTVLANTPAAAAVILGIGLTALPSLSDIQSFQRIASHTVSNTEVKAANNLTEQVLPNFAYTLTASLTFQGHSHFISGAHLDPLSSMLMLLGLGVLLTQIFKRRLAVWALVSFLLACLFVGGLAPYPYPPLARTFILVIFYAIFAAVGAEWLLAGVRQFASGRLASTSIWLLLILAIPALNLYQFFVLTDRVNPQQTVAMLVKEFQEQPFVSTFYLVARLPYNHDTTRIALKAYDLDPARLQIVSDANPTASLAALKRSAKMPYEILMTWSMPTRDTWRTALREVYSGYAEVQIKDATDLAHFAKVLVSDGNAASTARATPTLNFAAASPYVVSPELWPRVAGSWKVSRPRDVAIGPDGLIYVINASNNTIEAHEVSGKLVRTVPGNWKEPMALAFNAAQELIVLDSANPFALTRLRTDGSIVARSDKELGLASPRGMAVAHNGDIYIAETSRARVVRLNRELLLPEEFQTAAPLKQPTSVVFVDDKLIVADAPSLYVLSLSGAIINQWSITPYNTSQPPRFLPNQKQVIVMTNPEPGEIVVYDLQGQVVQKIGPPAYERLSKPIGIVAAGDGKIFVAENEADLIRIFDWSAP